MDIVALSYQTFSLVHLLIDYAFDDAIRIAYGNPNVSDEDGRNGALIAVKSGGGYVAETIHLIKPLALRVFQCPLRPAKQIRFNQIDHRTPFASGGGGHGRLAQIEEA